MIGGWHHETITYRTLRWSVSRSGTFWVVRYGGIANALFLNWEDAIDYATRKAS